jgi:sulfur carrier protein ThiS
MKITFKLYASLGEYLPAGTRDGNAIEIDVAPEASIADIIAPYNLPMKLVHLVLVNGAYVAPEARASVRLKEGDTLAIWPPIAGG